MVQIAFPAWLDMGVGKKKKRYVIRTLVCVFSKAKQRRRYCCAVDFIGNTGPSGRSGIPKEGRSSKFIYFSTLSTYNITF